MSSRPGAGEQVPCEVHCPCKVSRTFALDSVTARACAHLTSLGPAVSTPRSPHPLSPPLHSAVGRVARRMVATMASSLLLRPRAVLTPHPSSSSRRPLPAPRAQLQANIQQKPGLTARSDGERRQPAGTRLYSLAPYPLLLAALLPGGTALSLLVFRVAVVVVADVLVLLSAGSGGLV